MSQAQTDPLALWQIELRLGDQVWTSRPMQHFDARADYFTFRKHGLDAYLRLVNSDHREQPTA